MSRQRRTIKGLTEEKLIYFLYDAQGLEPGLDGFPHGFQSMDEVRDCYLEHREQILAEYIKLSPCKRPILWWTERNMPRPAHASNNYFDRITEAEMLHDLKELTQAEHIHLEKIRHFYSK